LIIVGVVVAYLTAMAISPAEVPGSTDAPPPPGSAQPT
jgi:hypothetical protein